MMKDQNFWKAVVKKGAVLNPVDRVAEVLFGLIMVLTFTGTISVATAGKQEIRELLWAALGCNVAWGFVDAIMYLMNVLLERGHSFIVIKKLTHSVNNEASRQILKEEIQPLISGLMKDEELDQLTDRIKTIIWTTKEKSNYRNRLNRRVTNLSVGVFMYTSCRTPICIFSRSFNCNAGIEWGCDHSFVYWRIYPGRIRWFSAFRYSDDLCSHRNLVGCTYHHTWRMKKRFSLFIFFALEVASVFAQVDTASHSPIWEFNADVNFYLVPNDFFVLPVFRADKNKLHLEARYNYEDRQTFSGWIGYNFKGGNKLEYTITPMVGGVVGLSNGIAPGLEITLAFNRFEFYSEGELFFDFKSTENNFLYNWTDITYSIKDWLWFGLSGQRTRLYQTNVDIQRGLLLGGGLNRWELNAYWYNIGSDHSFVILALSKEF